MLGSSKKSYRGNLEFPDAWDESVLPIERAHRTGKFEKGKTRPIVVRFSNYKQKNRILMSKSKSNSSGYQIQEQFSKKVARERKSFQPVIEKR